MPTRLCLPQPLTTAGRQTHGTYTSVTDGGTIKIMGTEQMAIVVVRENFGKHGPTPPFMKFIDHGKEMSSNRVRFHAFRSIYEARFVVSVDSDFKASIFRRDQMRKLAPASELASCRMWRLSRQHLARNRPLNGMHPFSYILFCSAP